MMKLWSEEGIKLMKLKNKEKSIERKQNEKNEI